MNNSTTKIAFMTMDVESLYDAGCFRKYNIEYNPDYSCEEAIKDYVDLLDEFQIKGTFFTLASSLEKSKEHLKYALKNGHEIALHGLSHISPLVMDIKDFKENIKKSKEILENELDVEIKGYRAPFFGINDNLIEILSELGFNYDSSNLNFKKAYDSGYVSINKYTKINDLTYVNNSFLEFCPAMSKLPISGGGYIRLIPWSIIKHRIKKYIKNHNCYMFYVHPFEIYKHKLPLPKKLSFLEKLYVKVNRKKYLNTIRKLIELLKDNGYSFCTMKDYSKKI